MEVQPVLRLVLALMNQNQNVRTLRVALFAASVAATLLATAAARAQPPLTPVPTAAAGYTEVVVRAPVKVVPEGPWMTRATQEGVWTMKIGDQPVRTVQDLTPPSFVREQRSYLLSWGGTTAGVRCLVTQTRDDGWIRARCDDNGARTVWINIRQVARIEELP
jgi:hypothetical protein